MTEETMQAIQDSIDLEPAEDQESSRRARKQAEYNRLRKPGADGIRPMTKGQARQAIQKIK